MAAASVHHTPSICSLLKSAPSVSPSSKLFHLHPIKHNCPCNRKSVWINPNNRSPSFLQKCKHPKYAKLITIAHRLEACEPTEEAVSCLFSSLEDELHLTINTQELVSIINNLQSWQRAHLAFKCFKAKAKAKAEDTNMNMNLLLYNVTMKVLRKGRQWDVVEQMVEQMVEEGVKPDNFTFSTLISCARDCKMGHKAVEWFERMRQWGCDPDPVTYSAMLDAYEYGKPARISEALSLLVKDRPQGWRSDTTTLSTLIKFYCVFGNCKGAMDTYHQMKARGVKVKPNLIIFNTMIDAMGRACKPGLVRSLHKEMREAGFLPNRITFRALITAYGRAHWAEAAFHCFQQMKDSGCELDIIVYNVLLNMCLHLGMVDHAFTLFAEMCHSHNCKPDNWTYNSMIAIYAYMGDVHGAQKMMNDMAQAGYEPDVFSFTSLIQGFAKLKRFDDVVRIADQLLEVVVSPQDRLCECLLSVLTQCSTRQEFGRVVGCIERANSRLASVAKLLVGEVVDIEVVMQDIQAILEDTPKNVNKAYCNCFIDLCWNFEFPDRAHKLLNMGTTLRVYTKLQSKSHKEWSLNLKSLSFGAALTAFQDWVGHLFKSLEAEEKLPHVFVIHTGRGKTKFSDKQLAAAIESYLREIGAPFHQSPNRAGWFLTTQVAIVPWLRSRNFS